MKSTLIKGAWVATISAMAVSLIPGRISRTVWSATVHVSSLISGPVKDHGTRVKPSPATTPPARMRQTLPGSPLIMTLMDSIELPPFVSIALVCTCPRIVFPGCAQFSSAHKWLWCPSIQMHHRLAILLPSAGDLCMTTDCFLSMAGQWLFPLPVGSAGPGHHRPGRPGSALMWPLPGGYAV